MGGDFEQHLPTSIAHSTTTSSASGTRKRSSWLLKGRASRREWSATLVAPLEPGSIEPETIDGDRLFEWLLMDPSSGDSGGNMG